MSRVCLLVLFVAVAAYAATIDHVVVLMLENRAFDHMCGWLKRNNSIIDGLTGNEFNIANGTKYFVKDTCPYVNPFDPNHDFPDVTRQVMGQPNAWFNPAPMDGFAADSLFNQHPEFWTVMHGFSPQRVPAISTLAQEFAIFDHWHAALPGPTVPNRLFFHSGSSHDQTGSTDLEILEGFPQRTVFDVLDDNQIQWAAYYQDISDLLYFSDTRSLRNIFKIQPWTSFLTAASEGTLPSYTWLSPQFYPTLTTQAKDQHPDHDVVEGEKLIAEVYAALRNGPKWNNTMFVVTYDEHGGFYDHVPPPQGIPNPTGINDKNNGFNFTRAGVRVCTIAAGPWIPKGMVVADPTEPGKHYEHSSIFNTLKNLFPMSDNAILTNRTTWAPAFDWVNSLSAPRTDCPTSLPTPAVDTPERYAEVLAEQQQRPPNGLQKELYTMLENVFGRKGDDVARFKTQQQIGEHIRHWMAEYKAAAHLKK